MRNTAPALFIGTRLKRHAGDLKRLNKGYKGLIMSNIKHKRPTPAQKRKALMKFQTDISKGIKKHKAKKGDGLNGKDSLSTSEKHA